MRQGEAAWGRSRGSGGSPSAVLFAGTEGCYASHLSLVATSPVLSPLAFSYECVLAGWWCLIAVGTAQEDTTLAVSADLELYIHLSCKNQNQIWLGFVNLISGGGWSQNHIEDCKPNEVCCSLLVYLHNPSKIYLYKNCSWPHLVLRLVLKSQHLLEALQLITR